FLVAQWRRESVPLLGPARLSPGGSVFLGHAFGIFGVGLGGAAWTAVIIRLVAYGLGVGDHVKRALGQIPAHTGMHVFSYVLGIPRALTSFWSLFLRPGRLGHRLLRPLWPEEQSPEASR